LGKGSIKQGEDKMNTNQKYKGKLFSILGDSVSTLDGYSRPYGAEFYAGENKFRSNVFSPEDTWWGKVIDKLGGELLVNNSFSGSTVCRREGCIFPSYGCSDERTSDLSRGGISPDVIMVYMGTNDRGYGLPPTADGMDEEDVSVFSVAYSLMLKKLKENYPLAEIWCFTLAASYRRDYPDTPFSYMCRGHHMDEYCEVIRSCAGEHGCRVIDLYKATESNRFEAFDGLHPSDAGMAVIAEAVLRDIGE